MGRSGVRVPFLIFLPPSLQLDARTSDHVVCDLDLFLMLSTVNHTGSPFSMHSNNDLSKLSIYCIPNPCGTHNLC